VEPFQLSSADSAAFWADAMTVAHVLSDLYEPTKMNCEIHGNTIPHLHMHLYPRFARDLYEGAPIDPRRHTFTRTAEELERLREALRTLEASTYRSGPQTRGSVFCRP
jgi:diadenosine tetraphosphate (Ap4A) HIT family hydrolase